MLVIVHILGGPVPSVQAINSGIYELQDCYQAMETKDPSEALFDGKFNNKPILASYYSCVNIHEADISRAQTMYKFQSLTLTDPENALE